MLLPSLMYTTSKPVSFLFKPQMDNVIFQLTVWNLILQVFPGMKRNLYELIY